METSDPKERTTATWKIFVIPGVLALVGYFALFAVDSWLRERRGPWEITFLVQPDGVPAVSLQQSGLGISDVTVRFEGESLPATATTNLPALVRMDSPEKEMPFGELVFHDLMYLPGTVVLHAFGHEVQMLPRGLFLNRREVPWENGRVHPLKPEEKLENLSPPTGQR